MNNPSSPQGISYPEILVGFIALVFVGVFYFLFRLLILKLLTSRGKPSGPFLSRLNLPGLLLLITLFLKLSPVKQAFSLSQKFSLSVDAAFLFFVFFFLIRVIDAFIHLWFSRRRVPFPIPKILHSITLAVLYLVILFIILKGILGVNITPFLATSAILTMILGLALQGVLSNILSGMSLHFTKSFSRGDWVLVGSQEGKVIDTNWRETRIYDRMWNIIVIPNNAVASEKVTNFSKPSKKTALTYPVKASYEASPSLVVEALLEAASDVPEVLPTPPPEAYPISYDDLGISYLLKFWITDFDRKPVILGDVGRLIWYKFKRQNIEIPLPLSDKLADVIDKVGVRESIPAIVEEKERTFRDLLHSSFLRYQEGEKKGEFLVSEDHIREFASSVRRVKFAPGEVVFKQGEKGENCYVVAKGKIKGEIIYEERGKKYTSEFEIGPGGIFGEMSLFTGMPRTATGVVKKESELLEVRAEDFARLLEDNPALAEIMAEIVSARNKKNQEFLGKIKELSKKDIEESCSKGSILNRLKSFILLLKK